MYVSWADYVMTSDKQKHMNIAGILTRRPLYACAFCDCLNLDLRGFQPDHWHSHLFERDAVLSRLQLPLPSLR